MSCLTCESNVIAEKRKTYEGHQPLLESTFVLLDSRGRGCWRFTPGRWTPL